MFDPRTRGHLLAAAVLVAVFMAGVLTATAVIQVLRAGDRDRDTLVAGDRAPYARAPRSGGAFGARPAEMDERLVRRLSDRLDLSDGQADSVREIIRDRRERTHDILESLRPRLEAQLDSTELRILDVLTPEQREAFQEFRAEGRRLLRGPGPGGPGAPGRPGRRPADGRFGPGS